MCLQGRRARNQAACRTVDSLMWVLFLYQYSGNCILWYWHIHASIKVQECPSTP
jgi:hypothetical protein